MKKGNKLKIIRVPIPTPTLLPHTTTNCYLLGNEHESILVDAGYDQPDTKIVLHRAMKENELALPKSIILTHSHPDHAPGVLQLVDWEPVVYCHRQEKQATIKAIAPWNQLSFLEDGDKISIAGEEIIIIHAPGHTAGQLNLYIPSKQILLAGDNIVAEGTSWIGLPDGDMSDYIQTLTRLKQLKLTKIGPGHGEWVENPYEHIDFVLGRRFHRENQIKSLLKDHGSLSVVHLTNLIYDKLPHPNVFEVAKRTTEAHLIKLIKEGFVAQVDTYYSLISTK
ncbi:beta-lactamase domain-containing protein [Neobacillus bataviensis LMG 21833]|uniref:Beta-lactamase domain-containing protein n=1 Tax=Neobacillus bataviensis LMG 21833 TaxID=1117379 RepID=K6DHJ6_9BACI|nr:MBL fold metallo-hydrolase [Neobacillus bataviensis]EKN67563.1 beta-lactamase domain-containing protein [Neobacillus bataviensis LMG 21833]